MLLAHDLGTTGDKASLHDETGNLIAATTVSYKTHYASGGVVEQDPEQWWRAVCQATKQLLDKTSTDPARIAGIGFSGQMMGAVFLDKSGESLRPAMIWADTRSTKQCDQLLAEVGMEQCYRLTGHRLNPTYSLTKVMWVKQNQPEIFDKVANVCLAKDYVAMRLTGRLVTDPSDASSTNAYDQEARRWSSQMLEAAGLTDDLFPEIVASTTVIGKVTKQAAGECGLAEGTPVVIGGGDGPLAAVGAGVVSPESGAYAYLGSSSWVSLSTPEPLYDPKMRTMTFDHVVPDQYVPTATMQAGAGSLAWVADLLSPGDDPARFSELTEAAAGVAAADEGLFFLPYLLGERSPYWNPAARGALIGLSRHHDRGNVVRAVLEGVGFNLLTCIDAFGDCGASIDRIDAIGGGASSDVWLQILANVWGVQVRRRSIVEEANSLGAALTAGVGVGLLDGFDAAGQLSQVMAEFDPDMAEHERLRAKHALFVEAYERLEPWFDHAQEAR